MTGGQHGTTASTEDQDNFRDDMIALIPSLRAFARGLCRDRTLADDLVQEAVMRAWAAQDSFTPGSNFRAWMFTILRNHFFGVARKAKRETSLDPEFAEQTMVQQATQEHGLALEDVDRAMAQLPPHQAEILWLIAGAGLTYEDAAEVVGCGIGTVKSRLNRARAAVKTILEGPSDATLVPRAQMA
jgi:RNA polymerase sigma-70 factor (ECF subfamily)